MSRATATILKTQVIGFFFNGEIGWDYIFPIKKKKEKKNYRQITQYLAMLAVWLCRWRGRLKCLTNFWMVCNTILADVHVV